MSYPKEKLESEFKATKVDVAKRVVQVVEGREYTNGDMANFEFIATIPEFPVGQDVVRLLETVTYKGQLVCKISASDSGRITIYPYIEL